jgi:hypothetical protein
MQQLRLWDTVSLHSTDLILADSANQLVSSRLIS